MDTMNPEAKAGLKVWLSYLFIFGMVAWMLLSTLGCLGGTLEIHLPANHTHLCGEGETITEEGGVIITVPTENDDG